MKTRTFLLAALALALLPVSAHQFSLTALWLFKEAGSYLCSHASCHLTHRSK